MTARSLCYIYMFMVLTEFKVAMFSNVQISRRARVYSVSWRDYNIEFRVMQI